MSNPSFEARLARVSDAASATAHSNAAAAASRKRGFGSLKWLILLPLAMALGAAAVIVGGVAQVVFVDGGLSQARAIPPQMSFMAIAIVLCISFTIESLVSGGRAVSMAVSLGFMGMSRGEPRLAEKFPEVWSQIYYAEYLTPLLELVGQTTV